MESSGEDQDIDNPGGGMPNGAAGSNGPGPSAPNGGGVHGSNGGVHGSNGAHGLNGSHGSNRSHGSNGQHRSPEDLTFRENNEESEYDEEEEDEATAQARSSLVHLSSLMNAHNPQFLAKFGMGPVDPDMIQERNGLEVLQAAMNSSNNSNFNIPLFPPSIYMPPQQLSHHSNHHSPPSVATNMATISENSLSMPTSSTPLPVSQPNGGASPVPGCSRYNGDSSQVNYRNNGESSRESDSSRPGTSSGQHTPGNNWSFEEQFKQLYELDKNPARKEFLDNLFTFMQQRGTPMNRLPIMAKSVLDLFELYNLVVARGGLVEVINKKLWQEIIKGLRLPASITSAAFTLRTQYMKYLYPYESHTENLSTREQLQVAIETNRREGRTRNPTYVTYSTPRENMPSNQHNSLPPNSLALTLNSMPLSLATHMAAASGASQHHGPQPLITNGNPHTSQHHPQHLQPNLAPNVSNVVSEYMMRMLREQRNAANNAMIPQQAGTSTPPPTTPEGALNAFDLSRITLWNIYHQNNKAFQRDPGMSNQLSFSPPTDHSPLAAANSPEPQREALDLANCAQRMESDRSSTRAASPSERGPPERGIKRNHDNEDLSPNSCVRKITLSDDDERSVSVERNSSMHIKQVVSQDDGRKELIVTVHIDGVCYQGILPAKNEDTNSDSSSSKTKASRNSDV